MQIFHTSPKPIAKVRDDGLFGDALCFAEKPYCMTAVDPVVYSIEISDHELLTPWNLAHSVEWDEGEADAELDELVALVGVDGFARDAAWDVLSSEGIPSDWWERDDASDLAWSVQRLQARLAGKAGCALKSYDEQGAVYIVPMTDRINKLERVQQ